MKKFLKGLLITLTTIYLLLCTLVYFLQESIIFFPEQLAAEYSFDFDRNFEEINLKTEDGTLLNGILFKADSSKGLVIHYHGNAGSVNGWGNGASRYNSNDYDLFIMDYRGFGKSEGKIHSEAHLFSDAQLIYDEMKKRYSESDIIIEGYSIGSGIAAEIAKNNSPKHLILCAPYYSLKDLMRHKYPILPTFLLKYPLLTHERVPKIKCPITLFHGDADEVIPFNSSERLAKLLKPGDQFIPLSGANHNGVQGHLDYIEGLRVILARR